MLAILAEKSKPFWERFRIRNIAEFYKDEQQREMKADEQQEGPEGTMRRPGRPDSKTSKRIRRELKESKPFWQIEADKIFLKEEIQGTKFKILKNPERKMPVGVDGYHFLDEKLS